MVLLLMTTKKKDEYKYIYVIYEISYMNFSLKYQGWQLAWEIILI